jgi:hypothetical protein
MEVNRKVSFPITILPCLVVGSQKFHQPTIEGSPGTRKLVSKLVNVIDPYGMERPDPATFQHRSARLEEDGHGMNEEVSRKVAWKGS